MLKFLARNHFDNTQELLFKGRHIKNYRPLGSSSRDFAPELFIFNQQLDLANCLAEAPV